MKQAVRITLALVALCVARAQEKALIITPAYNTPPSGDVMSLPITSIGPEKIYQTFWATDKQVWEDDLNAICVYDQPNNYCRTNIGYYIHASGLKNATSLAFPGFQFFLRFQMREACHGAAISDGTGGSYCTDWKEDWSQYPLYGPSRFNVSQFCRTVYDPSGTPLGCANNFAPWSVESDAQWAQWHACTTLPFTVPDPAHQMTHDACQELLFELQTGWNFTVLFRAADLVLQNGDDCNKWYIQRTDGVSPDLLPTVCQNGTATPTGGPHPVLQALQIDPNKMFYGTFEQPLDPKVHFMPPPPNPPPPPPVKPPPPIPPSPPFTAVGLGDVTSGGALLRAGLTAAVALAALAAVLV